MFTSQIFPSVVDYVSQTKQDFLSFAQWNIVYFFLLLNPDIDMNPYLLKKAGNLVREGCRKKIQKKFGLLPNRGRGRVGGSEGGLAKDQTFSGFFLKRFLAHILCKLHNICKSTHINYFYVNVQSKNLNLTTTKLHRVFYSP